MNSWFNERYLYLGALCLCIVLAFVTVSFVVLNYLSLRDLRDSWQEPETIQQSGYYWMSYKTTKTTRPIIVYIGDVGEGEHYYKVRTPVGVFELSELKNVKYLPVPYPD